MAKNTASSFKDIFEKITGEKIAEEICNSYDITLHIDSTVDCQKLLDENDLSGTNHVIISPETLSKMENDHISGWNHALLAGRKFIRRAVI